MLEGADDLGCLPLLARGAGERGHGVGLDDLDRRQLRGRPSRTAGIRLGDAVDRPDAEGRVAVGIERVEPLGLIGRDRDVRPGPDAGRAERKLDRDRLRETLAALHDDLQIHRSIAGQGRLRRHDLEVERQRLNNRHREFVDLRPVVDGVVGLPQNEVGEVLEGSAHLDVLILRTGLERHQPPGEGRVGGGFEDDRHLRHRPRHLAVDGR